MPGLTGITWDKWLQLLRENQYAVDLKYYARACGLTLMSLWNSHRKSLEDRLYHEKISTTQVFPPLFILGHWRSGTTLLHSLISLDEQFAYPNEFQAARPYSFLTGEAYLAKVSDAQLTQKRSMDNIVVLPTSPSEDEFALAVLTLRSHYLGWTFPRNEGFYDRYISFRGVSEVEIESWKKSLVWFLQKLTLRYNRPLVLKSPPHTARIQLLLGLFPQARFIHIVRNPFDVFRSTLNMFHTTAPLSHLQKPDGLNPVDGIFKRFIDLNATYLAQRAMIPSNRLVEVRFEDLEQNKSGVIAHIYEALGLEGFYQFEPKLREYVDKINNYQKSRKAELSEDLRVRIIREWQPYFDAWRY